MVSNMKKIAIFGLLGLGLVMGGCGQAAPTTETKMTENVVEKTGELKTKVGDEYVFQSGGELINVTSSKIDLDAYMGKKITISGMYSGSTLYIDEIR